MSLFNIDYTLSSEDRPRIECVALLERQVAGMQAVLRLGSNNIYATDEQLWKIRCAIGDYLDAKKPATVAIEPPHYQPRPVTDDLPF